MIARSLVRWRNENKQPTAESWPAKTAGRMTVIADTSRRNYLILIDETQVLPALCVRAFHPSFARN